MTIRTRFVRRLFLAGVLAVFAVTLAGCDREAAEDELVLDGRPRVPSTGGVIAAIEGRTIRLRDGRSFVARDDFRSFSTYTLKLEPMRNRIGEYVQLAVNGDEARWMAGIGALLTDDPPRAIYTGRLVRLDDERRAVFRDGTVFRLAKDVVPPPPGPGIVQVEIDAETNEAVSLTLA